MTCHKQDCARVYGRAFITSYKSRARNVRIRELVYDRVARAYPDFGRTEYIAPVFRQPHSNPHLKHHKSGTRVEVNEAPQLGAAPQPQLNARS